MHFHSSTLLLVLGAFVSVASAAEITADLAEQTDFSDEGCDLSLRQLRARHKRNKTEELDTANVLAGEQEAEPAENLTDTLPLDVAAGIRAAAEGNYSEDDDELGALWHHTHHGGHRGPVMTLYHQTSPSIGPLILRQGFKPGQLGWCGGGIYFATSVAATFGKAVGENSHHGFIIAAQVDLGRLKYMPKYCTSSTRCWGKPVEIAIHCLDRSNEGGRFRSEGYDSVSFSPGGGREYVIWDHRRVISMRQV